METLPIHHLGANAKLEAVTLSRPALNTAQLFGNGIKRFKGTAEFGLSFDRCWCVDGLFAQQETNGIKLARPGLIELLDTTIFLCDLGMNVSKEAGLVPAEAESIT